ncbi:Hypothetical predicted protein [Paramuricea clavata]|uniref:Uncharacterized protein n=1 Tax=Paramuricea clavata TaxID=317549 RepID=A0A7D9LAV2_PARCT|nr:Hypothetical predicted protein [Paramuricea clavata]
MDLDGINDVVVVNMNERSNSREQNSERPGNTRDDCVNEIIVLGSNGKQVSKDNTTELSEKMEVDDLDKSIEHHDPAQWFNKLLLEEIKQNLHRRYDLANQALHDDFLFKSCFTKTLYYNENKSLPVYKCGLTKGISTDKVADIIINGCKESSRVASSVPTAIEKNVVFVVKTDALGDREDIKCDDLGGWTVTGSKKFLYEKKQSNVQKISIEENVSGRSVFLLRRLFYKNISLPSLRKSIVTAENLNTKEQLDLAFVQYIFTEGEQRVHVKPHGNSNNKTKESKPYKRTMQSTKDLVQAKLAKHSPRKVVHDVIEERGGIDQIQSAGEFPRNRTQIYNAKRGLGNPNGKISTCVKDPFLDVLIKAKEEQCERNNETIGFIRDIPMFPEPVVFLTTEQQLFDVERFCTNPESFCVLGVDATFQISDYYFTFVTYQNLLLETERGNHPVTIGPGILHKRKLTSSYKNLPLLMTKYQPGINGVLVYGTDGEPNLYHAFSDVFSDAKHLRCDIHLRDNIQHKLDELGMTKEFSMEIISDIFGKNVGDKREGGLIDCTSSDDFDQACDIAVKKWSNFSKGEEFVKYFLDGRSDVLRESCRADIRSMCGLGYPPRVYTQNANECMNRVIKQTKPTQYGKKSLTFLEYVEKIESEVKRQQEEQFLAVIGRGEYRLRKEFEFLHVDEANFYRMTPKQKIDMKKKFFTISVSEKNGNVSSTETNPVSTQSYSLSVTATQSQIINVPFQILRPMFEKASRTVETKSNVWKVPSLDHGKERYVTYMVMSQTSPKPHTVFVHSKTNKVECDSTCVNFTSYRICSHCIAAAEMAECLPEFLSWFRKGGKKTNLTSVVNINMPANAGKKISKATQRRKGSSNKEAGKSLMPVVSRLTGGTRSSGVFQPRQVPTSAVVPGPGYNQLGSFSMSSAVDVQNTGCPPNQFQMNSYHFNSHPYSLHHRQQQISVPMSSAFNDAVQSPSFQYGSLHHRQQQISVPMSSAFNDAVQSPSFQYGINPQLHIHPGKPNPAPGAFVIALLKFTDPRVCKCYGCRDTLKPDSAIPPCPNDMIIASRQFRKYFKADGKEHTSPELSMVYFHARVSCILLQFPGYLGNTLSVPSDLVPHLQESHKQLLRKRFNILL